MLQRIRRVVEEMQAGRLLAIKERGVIVTCVEGTLWITRDGDRKDIVLAAGESFENTRPGRVLVQALAASRVHLQVPALRWVIEKAPLLRIRRRALQGGA